MLGPREGSRRRATVVVAPGWSGCGGGGGLPDRQRVGLSRPGATSQIPQTPTGKGEAGCQGGACGRPRGHHAHFSKGLILAQNERWRRGLGMQVVRARPPGRASGARVSKATVTHPTVGDSRGKPRVIPSDVPRGHPRGTKGPPPWDGPSWYQVVGEVTAHQASDAYRACERGPAHWD